MGTSNSNPVLAVVVEGEKRRKNMMVCGKKKYLNFIISYDYRIV